MHSDLALRFFGQHVRVTCDADEVTQALGLIYERQRDDSASVTDEDVHVLVESDGPNGPRVVVGDRSVRAPSPDQLLHYAHLVLVNAAAASASGVQVLHAGAVERDGRAVVIVAPSGGGKTTTSLAMVNRGWRLLSDDFAVVASDGTVSPFLRRLNLTDDTLTLLGLTLPPGAVRVATSSRDGKWMVDVDELVPLSAGGSALLDSVFVMGPRENEVLGHRAAAQDSVASRSPTWRILVDHLPAGLEESLASIRGVCRVSHEDGDGGTLLEVTVEDNARIVPALDETLASFDVAALSVSKTADPLPAPGPRPCVAAMSLEDAAAAILPHDLGLSGRRFLHGTDVAAVAAAWLGLTNVMADLGGRVFRLWPGDVDPTVDLIEACLDVSSGATTRG